VRLRNSVSIVALTFANIAVLQAQPVATDNNTTIQSNVFDLGQIEQLTITAAPTAQAISQSTISADETYKFNALTVDRAIDLAPGVASSTTGGRRNEKLFFVRGFDRFQSPLFIDGIRVYLPADNRLDLGFFNTDNLAQIQIDKGYVSVLSGPGALGGAINLVTRKPSAAFEYRARAGLALAGNGAYNGYNASASLGGKTGKFYWQVSGGETKTDHFRLADSYDATPTQASGFRDHTDAQNYDFNAKVGLTPNVTDEYSLSYSGTWGKKAATFSVTDPVASQQDWRWPYWDVQSLYFLSNTKIGRTAYVKTKLYYNKFDDGLSSFDNAGYNTQATRKAFNSYNMDHAAGGSIEAGDTFAGRDILKSAFFYRKDTHVEWQKMFVPEFIEPQQRSVEDTYSMALENRFHVTDKIDLVAGTSYDWHHLEKAQDYADPTITEGNLVPGGLVNYPLADGHADNVQGAVIYNYSDAGHVYANVSDRTRFPTLLERFGTHLGVDLPNPSLKEERALNYEIGVGDTVFRNTRVDGAVFYSDLTNALQNVTLLFCDTTSTTATNCTGAHGLPGTLTAVNQIQNVGRGTYFGFEASGDTTILDNLQAGLRLTYINRTLAGPKPADPLLPTSYHLTGVPPVQAFAYVTWNPIPKLDLTPNIQVDAARWSQLSAGGGGFVQTGSFVLLNFEADYAISDGVDFQVGARNLLDQSYQLVLGFPSEGRNFFVNFRVRS
jgi:iron complex outermembrane recepter protein